MKRFYTAIVRRRRLVLAVFALAAVLSVFAVRQVKAVSYTHLDVYKRQDIAKANASAILNRLAVERIPNAKPSTL